MRALLLDMGAWSVPGVHFDKKLMCQAIAQSLFRQGRFDLGEAFCRECGLEMKEVSITHPRSLSLSLSLSLSSGFLRAIIIMVVFYIYSYFQEMDGGSGGGLLDYFRGNTQDAAIKRFRGR
eukprot:TRINITY_DN4712_c0_g2_i2.p1 TRINITY_DN4712_c0_g2~~TRINITY_DN4712_c0_g2_i2.p1  ORF type:complete len:121 (-),score=21.85 TRINITY_DN4712_c0_g2_i2:276-638(-)